MAPASAQVRNPWNGLYVGLHGGYAWQDVDGIFDSSGDATVLSAIDLNGAIIGGQLGYNYQSGQFLLGIEGDASTLANGGDTVITTPALPGAASLERRHELPCQHSRPARLGDQQLAAVRHRRLGLLALRVHRELPGVPLQRQSSARGLRHRLRRRRRMDARLWRVAACRISALRPRLAARSIPINFPDADAATASASTTSTSRARRSTSSSATSRPWHTAERHSVDAVPPCARRRHRFAAVASQLPRILMLRAQAFGNRRGIVEWVPSTKGVELDELAARDNDSR